jgi:hypothetical protein
MRKTTLFGSPMAQKVLVAVAVAFITVSFAVTPADARSKLKTSRTYAHSKLQTSRTDGPGGYSLDGRVLGHPRTCGYNTYLDGGGAGPYCH